MKQTRSDSLGVLEFSFDNDFSMEFITDIKREIAPEYRGYNPDTKIWTIKKAAWPVFRAIYKRHYIGENQEELF